MIARDEASFIEECLASVRPHVDEIVFVDTGSTDGTRDMAAPFADTLLDFAWRDDFSAARNSALDAATGEWVLVLDADERIDPADYPRLRDALEDERYDGYYLTTRNYMNRRPKGWVPAHSGDPLARGFDGFTTHDIMKLFRRRDDIRYRGRVHEIVDYSVAEVARGRLPVCIHHYGDANDARPRSERALQYLRIMEEELAECEDARTLGIAGNAALVWAEDYQKAARYLHRAAELGYKPDECLEQEAEARYRAGEHGPALDLYRYVYSRGVRSPAMCLNMANLTVRSGDRARSAELLRECLALGGVDEATDRVIRENLARLDA
jgi:hypothetical protein